MTTGKKQVHLKGIADTHASRTFKIKENTRQSSKDNFIDKKNFCFQDI